MNGDWNPQKHNKSGLMRYILNSSIKVVENLGQNCPGLLLINIEIVL